VCEEREGEGVVSWEACTGSGWQSWLHPVHALSTDLHRWVAGSAADVRFGRRLPKAEDGDRCAWSRNLSALDGERTVLPREEVAGVRGIWWTRRSGFRREWVWSPRSGVLTPGARRAGVYMPTCE
jgi:hypothetical protein